MIEGKKILFIGQKFYNYHLLIIDELEKLGANVVFYENKFHNCDFKSSTSKFLSLVELISKGNTKRKYQRKILSAVSDLQFDLIFVIGGFSISNKFILKLKQLNPHAKSILFLWDSLYYWKYHDIIGSFDDCYSFDKNDSKRYGIKYLSDFYLATSIAIADKKKYFLSHVGSVHFFALHRIDVLERIKAQADAKGLSCYLSLYAPKLFSSFKSYFTVPIKFILDPIYRKFIIRVYIKGSDLITHKRISLTEVEAIESSSIAVIDIPPIHQYGNSIRAISCLARNQKLITTNQLIVEEDFYHPNNISILSINQPILDIDFADSPFINKDLSNLQLNKWLSNLLII